MANIGHCPPIVTWLELKGDISVVDVGPLGGYGLSKASKNAPDHTPAAPRHGVRKGFSQKTICHHSPTASSWVERIGLVILEDGTFGIYAKFFKGGEIVYTGWNNFDDTAGIYKMWKEAFSKGKMIHNMLWSQDYYSL
jgi:hypothetical protein